MNKFKIDKKSFFLLNKLIQKVSGLDSAIGFHAEFINILVSIKELIKELKKMEGNLKNLKKNVKALASK